jgi:hypothetical protein
MDARLRINVSRSPRLLISIFTDYYVAVTIAVCVEQFNKPRLTLEVIHKREVFPRLE